MQAIVYKDDLGQQFEVGEIPAELAEQAHEYHHQLIDTISHFDDEVLEAYIEDESSVTPEQIRRALRAGTLSDEITPVLLGSAFKNKGVQPLLDAVIDYLPSPLDVPPVTGIDPKTQAEIDARADARRAVLGARLQGHVRSVRRQADLLPRLQRQAQGRRPRAQHDDRQDRARSAASSRCTRTAARSARRSARARSRPGVGLKADDDRRHALGRDAADRARVDDVPRAGDLGRGRAEVEGRPGQALAGPRRACPRRIRPSASPPTRRRGRRSSQGWASCTSRSSSTGSSASSTSTRTSAARRSPTARRVSRPAENIRGKFVRQTGGSGQYGDVGHQPVPAGARRRLRVRGQDRRRQDPEGVHRRGRCRHPGGDGLGRPRRLPRRRRQGRARRRLLPRGRLERARVQDRRLDGLQGGDEAGEADPARADDGRRGDDARGVPRRRDGQPELAARAHRVDEPRRQRPGRPGERAAVARCSATRPTSARCRRAGQRSTWISTITRKFRNRSPARSSSRAAAAPKRVNGGRRNGQAEVRALEAARQRRHDRAHRPRQDHADRGDHEGARRAGRRTQSRATSRRSTPLPRSASAASRSTPRTSSTRPRRATTRTSTARVTPTTSRT